MSRFIRPVIAGRDRGSFSLLPRGGCSCSSSRMARLRSWPGAGGCDQRAAKSTDSYRSRVQRISKTKALPPQAGLKEDGYLSRRGLTMEGLHHDLHRNLLGLLPRQEGEPTMGLLSSELFG